MMPDALAAFAASSALAVSDIPFQWPHLRDKGHQAWRRLQGQSYSPAEMEEATLDLIVAADAKNILMVEGEAKEAQEDEMLEALTSGP